MATKRKAQPAPSTCRWHLIGCGFNGWHARGFSPSGNAASSSNGDLMPQPWWAGGFTRGYLEDAVDGGWIYDAKHLEGAAADAFARFIRASRAALLP